MNCSLQLDEGEYRRVVRWCLDEGEYGEFVRCRWMRVKPDELFVKDKMRMKLMNCSLKK